MPNKQVLNKQFDVDVSTAISATSSSRFRGGVVYTFPDGSTADVHGGDSIGYRANSPGFHGGPSDVPKYGAIGVARSREGTPNETKGTSVLVFATKEAADAALVQRLGEIDSRSTTGGPTVGEILSKYHSGPNPAYAPAVLNILKDPNVTTQTKYRSLTDAQKANLRESIFREEGYYDKGENADAGYVETIKYYLGKLIPGFTPPPAQKSSLVLPAANDGIEATPLPPPPSSAENNIPGTNIPDPGILEGGASLLTAP